jgi:hypothetical protein
MQWSKKWMGRSLYRRRRLVGGLFSGCTIHAPVLVNWLGNVNWDSQVSAYLPVNICRFIHQGSEFQVY